MKGVLGSSDSKKYNNNQAKFFPCKTSNLAKAVALFLGVTAILPVATANGIQPRTETKYSAINPRFKIFHHKKETLQVGQLSTQTTADITRVSNKSKRTLSNQAKLDNKEKSKQEDQPFSDINSWILFLIGIYFILGWVFYAVCYLFFRNWLDTAIHNLNKKDGKIAKTSIKENNGKIRTKSQSNSLNTTKNTSLLPTNQNSIQGSNNAINLNHQTNSNIPLLGNNNNACVSNTTTSLNTTSNECNSRTDSLQKGGHGEVAVLSGVGLAEA